MQNNAVMYNSHKTNGWCNNRNPNILREINYRISHQLLFPLGYNTSIISLHSQQYINYRCKKNQPSCYSLYLHISFITFLHKAIVHGSVFVPLSYILVSKPTHRYNFFAFASFFSQVKKPCNKKTNLEACFFYNSFLY